MFHFSESNNWRNDEGASTNDDGHFLIQDFNHIKSTDNYEFYNNSRSVDNATTLLVFSNQETIANITLGDIETGGITRILTD